MDGLIALAAGVVGALIAIVGTLGLELRREDIARDGAARALFFELAQNTGWLIKAIEFETYIPLDVSTWRASRVTISTAVSPADFATIAYGYSHLLTIIAAEAATGPGKRPGIVGAATDALPFVERAGVLMLRRGWPTATDRAAMTLELERLTGVPRSTWAEAGDDGAGTRSE